MLEASMFKNLAESASFVQAFNPTMLGLLRLLALGNVKLKGPHMR